MSESVGNKRKRGKKQYYDQPAKKRKGSLLQGGDKGFFVTCNNGNESRATRELCDLLNEYAEKFYAPAEAEGPEPVEDKSDEDLESALKNECDKIKGLESSSSSDCRRFWPVNCGVKNCCFVKSTIDDDKPSMLVYKILKDLKDSRQQKCRFIQRLLPADVTCKTNEKDFTDAAKVLIENEFNKQQPPSSSLTYAVEFRSRNNDQISKETAYNIVGELISLTNPTIKVNLTKPDKTILVDVLGKVCCLSVVDEYHNLRRYNVHEIINPSSASSKVDNEEIIKHSSSTSEIISSNATNC